MSDCDRKRYHYHYGTPPPHNTSFVSQHNIGSYRNDVRTSAIGRQGRSVPAKEDSETSGVAPRRRIPVACGRCRKRKIRCSGDPGDGTGCINCRQAGVEPHGCQFVRIASFNCPVIPRPVNSAMAAGTVIGASSTPYATSTQGTYSKTLPPYLTSVKSLPYIQHRYDGSMYGDETPIEPYSLSSPSSFGSHDALYNIYSNGHSVRSWPIPSPRPVSSHDSGYLDPDSLTSSVYGAPTANMRPQRQFSADGISNLTMSPLEKYLPMPMTKRHLPMPNAARSHSFLMGTPDSLTKLVFSPPQPQTMPPNIQSQNMGYASSSIPWTPDSAGSEGSRTSITSSVSTESISQPCSTVDIACTMAEASGLGYHVFADLGTSDGPPQTSAPTLEYITTSVSETGQQQSLQGLLNDPSPSVVYPFTSDRSSKPMSTGDEKPHPESRLISGERYIPLMQPQPQMASSPAVLHSFDNVSTVPHRSASLSDLKRLP